MSGDAVNLAPGTVYHYRLVATNASGSIPGKDRTFTTRPAVALSANKLTGKFNESITLSGQVFGTAVAGITVTLQENPYPFGGFNEVSTTTTDASGRYQFIRPLRTNTAWRVVAGTKPPGTSNTALVLEADAVSIKANTSRPEARPQRAVHRLRAPGARRQSRLHPAPRAFGLAHGYTGNAHRHPRAGHGQLRGPAEAGRQRRVPGIRAGWIRPRGRGELDEAHHSSQIRSAT